MHSFESNSCNGLCVKGFNMLKSYGEFHSSDKGDTLFLKHVTTKLTNPKNRYLFLKGRTSSVYAMLGELIWVMSGSNKVEPWLTKFLKRAPIYANHGEWMMGYGPRLYSNDQLGGIIQQLLESPNTRQAVLSIFDPEKESYQGMKNTLGEEKFNDRSCLASYTKVFTSRGRIPICEVVPGDFVLSVNEKSKRVEAKVVQASMKTKTCSSFIRISSDYGDIDCTPDHIFLVRKNGEFFHKEAKDLTTSDILVSTPIYYRNGQYSEGVRPRVKRYLNVNTGNSNMVDVAHIFADSYGIMKVGDYYDENGELMHLHHINGDYFDNRPENLERINASEHNSYHMTINNPAKFDYVSTKRKFLGAQYPGLTNGNYHSFLSNEEIFELIISALRSGALIDLDFSNYDNSACLLGLPSLRSICRKFNGWSPFLESILKFDDNIPEYIDINTTMLAGNTSNHKPKQRDKFAKGKILKISEIHESIDVWDIQVEDNHNFLLDNGVFVHNCNNLLYFSMFDKKLELTVVNRSNDVLFGAYSINLPEFTFIQEIVAEYLNAQQKTYLNEEDGSIERPEPIVAGDYIVFSNNYHSYRASNQKQAGNDTAQKQFEAVLEYYGRGYFDTAPDCKLKMDLGTLAKVEPHLISIKLRTFFTGLINLLSKGLLGREEVHQYLERYKISKGSTLWAYALALYGYLFGQSISEEDCGNDEHFLHVLRNSKFTKFEIIPEAVMHSVSNDEE